MERIAEKKNTEKPVVTPKTEPKQTVTPTDPQPAKSNVITEEEFLAPVLDKTTPKPTESIATETEEADPWAKIRGMRDADTMIANLKSGGITSLDDLRSFFWNTHHDDDHSDELAELNAKIKPIDKLIRMMKQRSQHSATYKKYRERSALTQNHFRKKNAAAIDSYEEADKYIKEHIKAYYIKDKAPKQSELHVMSDKLKEKYNALVPEHRAFLKRQAAASQYTRQVRRYLDSKRQQESDRQYKEWTSA
jgi:putative conjugative transposon mobilization protein